MLLGKYQTRSCDEGTQGAYAKYTADCIVALAGLIVLGPLLLLIAGAIVVFDGKGVLFFQPRVGEGGRIFRFYKFRTMRVGAEDELAALLTQSPQYREEWHRYQKLRCDPRVTRLGAWLRRTSLDELPQLLNIVLGDMSFVGPRPLMPEQVADYGAAMADYVRVRPGLTGPWQVLGRNAVSFAGRARLESAYVRQWSWQRDMAILWRTFPAVVKKGRAF
jgi:exopolysaccharide production protein ExoY